MDTYNQSINIDGVWANAKQKEVPRYLNNSYMRLNGLQIRSKNRKQTHALMEEIHEVLQRRYAEAGTIEDDINKLQQDRALIATAEIDHYNEHAQENGGLSNIDALTHINYVRATVAIDLQLAEAYRERANYNQTNMQMSDDYRELLAHYESLSETESNGLEND